MQKGKNLNYTKLGESKAESKNVYYIVAISIIIYIQKKEKPTKKKQINEKIT